MFKLAEPRGRRLSIYVPYHVFAAVQPWAAGRARSGRIAAIIGRYADTAARRPDLNLYEAGILVQLLGPLAGMRDVSALWGELLDLAREGERLPDRVNAEELAGKVRRLTVGEQLGLLELADRTAMGDGSLRERLIAAGIGG
jgi:hypothetical protein